MCISYVYDSMHDKARKMTKGRLPPNFNLEMRVAPT